jgi:hypothetical protein
MVVLIGRTTSSDTLIQSLVKVNFNPSQSRMEVTDTGKRRRRRLEECLLRMSRYASRCSVLNSRRLSCCRSVPSVCVCRFVVLSHLRQRRSDWSCLCRAFCSDVARSPTSLPGYCTVLLGPACTGPLHCPDLCSSFLCKKGVVFQRGRMTYFTYIVNHCHSITCG